MELKVGFSRPKAKWKILSNLICWVQRWNKASHTYLVLWDKATQQEIVFHAAFPKVSLIPKSEFGSSFPLNLAERDCKSLYNVPEPTFPILYSLYRLLILIIFFILDCINKIFLSSIKRYCSY